MPRSACAAGSSRGAKLYFAYGSNLNMAKMRERCPNAVAVGTARLDGYRLLCRTGDSGTYLTVEPAAGSSVPLGVWQVRAADEVALDAYEGYPRLYLREHLAVPVRRFGESAERMEEGLIYRMYEHFPMGVPDFAYVEDCLAGYRDFGFDPDPLLRACAGE